MRTLPMKFVGGMTTDIRDETAVAKLIKHFDILTRPRSLTPYHSQIAADGASATNRITDALIGQSSIIYAGGNDTVTGNIKIWEKGYTGSTWIAATGGVSTGSRQMVPGVFVNYHNAIYGGTTGGEIWKYDTNGSSFTNASTSLSSGVCQSYANGVVHSKDDVLYIPYVSSAGIPTIASNNNGSWTTVALSLPSRYVITSLCEYGNYLAIACAPVNTGKSVVYLWDRDSTLNTVAEVIDFGAGNIQIIEQIEGEIIGISIRTDAASSLGSRVVFRSYSGGVATVFRELLASSTTGLQLYYGQKYNANRLYFLAGIEIDSVLHNGIWGVGKNSLGRWIVWFDRLPNNDTAIAASSLTGFFMTGDYTLISYNDGGYQLTQTSTTATAYAGSSIIETVINPSITGTIETERSAQKQLMAIAVAYDPIPTGGQAILKYKVDGSSWTNVFTETTVGKVVTEAVCDATGTKFTAGREYQFRIESSGGVIITEPKWKYEVLKTLI